MFGISLVDEVTVIRNGIDLPEDWQVPNSSMIAHARSVLRKELGIPGKARVALTVARLASAKGHHDLLAAIGFLPESCADVHFVWAGRGIEEAGLRTVAEAAGLAERVHLLGYRRDVATLLYAADLFVFPTHKEGLSLAVIEAMSAELPIVLSDASSNPELIDNGRHGLLFPAQDPVRLADRLRYALSHPAEMRRMAQAARTKARSELTSDTMCDNFLRIMNEVAHC